MDLLGYLDEEDLPNGATAVAALIMSIGRLAAPIKIKHGVPQPLDEPAEVAFLHSMMDFVGAYWAQGSIN